ncbi:hypothetical protein N7510_010336 [Penicillium lagena]|uniref:uncharacterized protein n=1 Tax=Penicillium lagena TaxID=94218 RepID=UPI002541E461|nr:uncharacterized protein N7510_010336 [Penicillium lagena]KAJ5605182.1 hypothetical protein N7510_010336 [Penicillium lagena]
MSEQPIAVDPDFYATHDAYQPSDFESETTSLASSIYRGVMENGRRYQTIKEGEYWGPSDEQQFESLEAGHLVNMILDSTSDNPLFQAPLKDPKHILDLGTGRGNWAVDVADMFPDANVRGVDLFPPPLDWLPPNCVLEVDDVLQEWTWRTPFDLIHLRQMIASFTPEEWTKVYKQCYDNLAPGGWIEQWEGDPVVRSDDGTMPENCHTKAFGVAVLEAGKSWGHSLDTMNEMRSNMEKAGFVDVHEKNYKMPVGPWPKDPLLKEAGRLHYHQWASGMEGWALYLLTKHGSPQPWTKEEVQVLMAKIRTEIQNPRIHVFQRAKRVWARKPTTEELAAKSKSQSTEQQGSAVPQIKQEPAA